MNQNSMKAMMLLALSATSILGTSPAQAFRACEDYRDQSEIYGCWPNYTTADRPTGTTPGSFGTKKWSFCYSYNNEGLELHDVMYGSDPSQRKLVAKRISMPYLMTRYPQPTNTTNPSFNPTSCGPQLMNPQPPVGQDSGPAFDDTPVVSRVDHAGAEMHCMHAPSTVCDLGERHCDAATHQCYNAAMSCTTDTDCIGEPASGALDPADCTGSCVTCRGVCSGTQVEVGGLELWGTNEVVSGSSSADVVLTTTNYFGGYQFTQRYRFKDDGTFAAKFRFGGNYRKQWHNHIAYWRFEFDLPGQSANDVVQRCESASCDDSSAGWSTRDCECQKTGSLPQANGVWRLFDLSTMTSGVPQRSIRIEGGPNDGEPTVCANTDKDYCILRTDAPSSEGLVKDPWNCLDGLPEYANGACRSGGTLATGGPIAFWYLGHHNGHDPCDASHQGFCEPESGEEAMGPVIRLRGAW